MYLLAPQITALNSQWLSKENTGLGNVLFQIASCYGLAKKTNRQLCLTNLRRFCDTLDSKYDLDHGNTIYNNFLKNFDTSTEITERINDTVGKKYSKALEDSISQSSTACLQINGHLECPIHFHKYKQEILELLRPYDYKQLVYYLYPEIFHPLFTPISIHIRNGKDAVKFNSAFYLDAIRLTKILYRNPYYFIFVDDVKSIPFESVIPDAHSKIIHTKKDYLDLFTMSFCHHHIISISTFAWWGTYLCEHPDSKIYISRDGVEFLKYHNDMCEEDIKERYFLNNVTIL